MNILEAVLNLPWTDIFAAIGVLVTAASAIVKLTPTQRDDAILGYVVRALVYVSVFTAKVAKREP